MKFIEIPVDLKSIDPKSKDYEVADAVITCRKTAEEMAAENRYMDAMERIVEGLRALRGYSDYSDREFRSLLIALLFDLSEIHFQLKDYKQSEKELETLFKVLESLVKEDAERFGTYHVMAMELSTRILRSRKKTIDLLVKQQQNAGMLYDKVNSGVSAATDRLIDALRNVGELLAATGDYRAALKFYSEAIKLSKKRTGKVTRREIKMSIDMAKVMMRVNSMRPRAKRLLEAVLPHAIALETIELEEDILALIQVIEAQTENESAWKSFMLKVHKEVKKVGKGAKEELKKVGKEAKEKLSKLRKPEISVELVIEDEPETEKKEEKKKKKGKK